MHSASFSFNMLQVPLHKRESCAVLGSQSCGFLHRKRLIRVKVEVEPLYELDKDNLGFNLSEKE